jgi:ferrous iron transport protein B
MPSYRWPTFSSIGLAAAGSLQGLPEARRHHHPAGHRGALGHEQRAVLHGKPPDIANSLAGTIGRTIEPVIKPLGFNWKIGIGLITAVFSRETIIATLGTIYGMDPETNKEGLQAALHHDLTLGGAVALLIFFAFAMQCISTIAVVRRETGGWKWPILQFSYMTVLAYVGAFAAFHLIR